MKPTFKFDHGVHMTRAEGKTRVRKSTVKTWNIDFFCNSAMELILVILKMASPSWEVHSKLEPHVVICMFKCCCHYLNSCCVYTSLYMYMHLHFCVSIKVPVTCTCTYQNTAYHSQQGWSEDIYRSTNPIGSWFPQTTVSEEKWTQFPLAFPSSENKCVLNPCLWQGWNRHLINSTAPPGTTCC